ncbi:putative protein 424R [Cricket iridovirus]|uniref:424R n=2 Tax=Iridovirus TaxID=10487 RepID=Q91FA1_IIV6|nr:424R [Invertebrate iridescent virus 6]AAK82284.1 424R [Invertebrate iridescent virus 6]QMS79519.1 hypothetical protein IIV6-T1_418 [Invertebrate iridescent virus 6]QNH08834.1 424R [Invertebrate iridescent virus Kaz2018]UIB20677.1 putative protein 424R [Cricket iridovirus]
MFVLKLNLYYLILNIHTHHYKNLILNYLYHPKYQDNRKELTFYFLQILLNRFFEKV